jgi:hypothetical protein
MALLRDNMDREMMNIINSDTQFISNDDEQDVDDASQCLALENMQENSGEVNIFEYVAIISFACTTHLFIFVYIAL